MNELPLQMSRVEDASREQWKGVIQRPENENHIANGVLVLDERLMGREAPLYYYSTAR